MNKVDEAMHKALYNVYIETPAGVLVDVKNVSYDDAWDHCQIVLQDHPDDKVLQQQLKECIGSFGTRGFGGRSYSINISAQAKFIKNAIDEFHTCGRRIENGHISGPFVGAGENIDTWDLRGEDLCCSYCGSLKPSRVLEIVNELGPGVIEVTDKNYKWYINRPEIVNAGFGGIKYYRQHDTKEFIDDLNKTIEEYKNSKS